MNRWFPGVTPRHVGRAQLKQKYLPQKTRKFTPLSPKYGKLPQTPKFYTNTVWDVFDILQVLLDSCPTRPFPTTPYISGVPEQHCPWLH